MNTLNHSRKLAACPCASGFIALLTLAGWLAMTTMQAAGLGTTNAPAAIPWNQIGAKAGADYRGDGLAVTPTESGARLHGVFQRLDGEARPEPAMMMAPALPIAIASYVSLRDRPAVASTGNSRRRFKTTLLNSLGRLIQPTGFRPLSLRQVLNYGKRTGDGRTMRTSSDSLFRERNFMKLTIELSEECIQISLGRMLKSKCDIGADGPAVKVIAPYI